MAIEKPRPSPPSRFSAGTRTSSRITGRVGWAFHPIFFSFGPNDRPSASAGTRNALMPRAPGSPVRAMTTYTDASPAPEMNCFTPVST